LRAKRVAGKPLEVLQPYHGVLPDDVVPFFDLCPVAVRWHPVEKNSGSPLVRPIGKNDIVAGFEFEAFRWNCVGSQDSSYDCIERASVAGSARFRSNRVR
jgi:hypothetical protein